LGADQRALDVQNAEVHHQGPGRDRVRRQARRRRQHRGSRRHRRKDQTQTGNRRARGQ